MPAGIAYGGAFIFLVAAFLVAWGLLTVYRLSLKQLLLGIAALFNVHIGGFGFSLGRPLGAIHDAIVRVADSIDHALAEAVVASESGIVWLWHALAKQAEWLGGLLGDLAETVEAKFRIWYLAFPPLAAIWAAVKLAQQLPQLWHAIHGAKATVVHVSEFVYRQGAQVTNVTKNYVQKAAAAAAGAVAATAVLPAPWLRARFRGIDETLKETLALAQRNAKLLAGAGAAALVLTAVGRLGLSWIRCPSLKAINRKHGCSPWRALEHLLAPALDILVFIDICVVAKAIRLSADAARPVLNELLMGIDAALCKGRIKPPPPLAVIAAALPPVPDPLTL